MLSCAAGSHRIPPPPCVFSLPRTLPSELGCPPSWLLPGPLCFTFTMRWAAALPPGPSTLPSRHGASSAATKHEPAQASPSCSCWCYISWTRMLFIQHWILVSGTAINGEVLKSLSSSYCCWSKNIIYYFELNQGLLLRSLWILIMLVSFLLTILEFLMHNYCTFNFYFPIAMHLASFFITENTTNCFLFAHCREKFLVFPFSQKGWCGLWSYFSFKGDPFLE